MFGPQTEAPILEFVLQANNIAITVNTITILNTGGVHFASSDNPNKGVSKVNIYLDNFNQSFSAVSDTLIGSVTLGEINPITKK